MNPKFFFIKTLFFFSGLLSLKNASSQTVFSGYIKNKQNAPVSFATVKLKRDTIQPQAIAYCIATDDGYFNLKCPATLKTGFIEISAVGYHTLYIYLPKIEGAEQRLSPVLEEDTKPLPEIYLKADLPIQVSGDTVTFKVDAFKHGDETNIVKLLSKMPGFTILENGKLAFNGEPITKVLLDNDDLTGTKYEELINTLSPSGIQKIQVFKNYKDPENIASQILNSNTQVLNLKYGDKFKGKVLGNVQAAVGLPLKYYDENAQLVSLIPKSKAVGIFNVNSVGELNENNTSSNSVSNDDNKEIADISSMANESLAEIKDLTLGSFRQRPIRNNNSGRGIVNFYFRPNKKLILKGSTGLFKDNYSQDVAVINNMYTPLQQIIQLQNKEISKNNNNFYQLLSVNYLINKRNQIAAVIKYDHAGINAHEVGLLNNEPYEGRLKGRDKQFNWKITYNHVFPSGSIFTFILLNKKSRLPNYYFFTPSYYDTLFYSSSLNNYNEQNELQTFSQLSSLLSYIKKGRKSSIVFNLSATKNTTSLFNSLYVYNNPESKILINNALTNNLRLNDNKISLNIQETLNLNRALSFTIGAELELRRQRISDRENNSVFESLNKFSVLPVISGSWDLKGQNRISFNYRMQNTTPMLRNLSEGYVLTGNTGLYKGFSTLQVQPAPFLQVSFAHMDLLRKGILLFTGFHLLRSPLFLLADQYPNFYYTFWQYQPTTKELPVTTFFFKTDKILPAKASNVSVNFNYSKGTNYALIQSQNLKTSFNQIKTGLDFNITIRKVSLNGGVTYSLTRQKRLSPDKEISSTQTLKLNSEASWKISKRTFINLTLVKNSVFPPQQSSIHLVQINSKLLIQSKNERIEWGITGNNLTNQQTFSYYQITPNQSLFTEYHLLPIQLLFFLKYKL